MLKLHALGASKMLLASRTVVHGTLFEASKLKQVRGRGH